MCPITTLCFYCHTCVSDSVVQCNKPTQRHLRPRCPTSNLVEITRLPNFLWWSWWHVVLTPPEDLLILYRSGIFAIDTSIVNFHTCPRHRDDLEVYWKRQKKTYRSPHPAKTSKSYAKCSRLRGIQFQASTCKDFCLISIAFLTVTAGKNLINC